MFNKLILNGSKEETNETLNQDEAGLRKDGSGETELQQLKGITPSPLKVLEAVEEEGSVVPLYLVTEGRAKKSYAAAVAALAGIPKIAVDRADCVYKYIRKGCLPPKWSLINDQEERKRCEAVVALLLSHDLEKDPIDELLSRIRRFAQLPTESTTSSPAPSTTSNMTPVPETPGSKSSALTQNATRSTADRGHKAPQSALLQPRTEGISHTTEEDIPDMSHGEKEEILTELSSNMTSLKMCVETVFSTGSSSPSPRNTSSSTDKIKQTSLVLSHLSSGSSSVCSIVEKHPTTETNKKTKALQGSSLENIKKLAIDLQHSPTPNNQSFTTITSSNLDRKRKHSFTPGSLHAPLETSESISDAIHRPQKCLREDSTSFSNAEETFEKVGSGRRQTSGKLSIDYTKRKTIQITFQDQDSLSGTSCSQESLLLQASWEKKSASGQHDTQDLQNLSSHNLGKENKFPFSFQDFSSDTNQNANVDTTSSLEKEGNSSPQFLKGIFSESSHSNVKQSINTMQIKHQISEKSRIKINREATNTFSQFKQTPSSTNCSIESLPFQKDRMTMVGQQDTQGFHISLSTSLSKETKSVSNFLLSNSSIDQTAEISSSPCMDISKKLQKTRYQLTSEDHDQESDSGMSYSQESLPLQRDWMSKLGEEEDNTQGFTTTNLEKQ